MMTKIDRTKFSRAIRQYREENDVTQRELAHRLLTTETTIARWETSVSVPKNELMIERLKKLGVHW